MVVDPTADVVGPSSSVDNTLARADGTTGKRIQFSGIVVDDSDNITIPVSALLKFINANAKISAGSDGTLDLNATLLRINQANQGDVQLGADGFIVFPPVHKTTGFGDSAFYWGDGYIKAITLLAGTGTDTPSVGGTLSVNTTAVGNVGTGEDDLMSYSIAANSMSGTGHHVRFRAAGTIANTVNAKRLRVKYGATTIMDTGAAGIPISTAISWVLTGSITRVGGTSQVVEACLNTSNATLASYAGVTTAAETLSGAVTLKLTGEATSNNDIVQNLMLVDWGSN